MTPAARYAAAIEVLDDVLSGASAEHVLLSWFRSRRFAGSKDRRAIRDHVFDALRTWRSAAKLGGSNTGRGLILGLLRERGIAIETVFSGVGYAPDALTEIESASLEQQVMLTLAEEANLPDEIWPIWERSLGDAALEIAKTLSERAPISLRINVLRAEVEVVLAALSEDGVTAHVHPKVPTGLIVTDGANRLRQTKAFQNGWFDFQDAASQMAVMELPLRDGQRVLDYCAGGGGKALAILCQSKVVVSAYDIDQGRMSDIPERAQRAGVEIEVLVSPEDESFDLVFVDAPCSGSGAWRRTPDAKLRATQDLINKYSQVQMDVLSNAMRHVAADGRLSYATCSIFHEENESVIERFVAANPVWHVDKMRHWVPSKDHDGFFLCNLHKINL